jgi:hypothetical protein
MGYYTRVLTKMDDCPPHADLAQAVRAVHPRAMLSCEDGDPLHWESLVLSHADGREIADIERRVSL